MSRPLTLRAGQEAVVKATANAAGKIWNVEVQSTAPSVVEVFRHPTDETCVVVRGKRRGLAHVVIAADSDAAFIADRKLHDILIVEVEGGCREPSPAPPHEASNLSLDYAEARLEMHIIRKRRYLCAVVYHDTLDPCDQLATQLVTRRSDSVIFGVCGAHSTTLIRAGIVRHLRSLAHLRIGDASRSERREGPEKIFVGREHGGHGG